MAENHRVFRILLLLTTTLAIVWFEAWCLRVFGFCSPLTAFLTDWFLIAWMATLAMCIHLPLPTALDDFKACEGGGRMYEYLGIRHFKQVVLHGPLSIFSRTVRLSQGNAAAALQRLERKLRRAEAIHVWSLFAVFPLIGYSITRGCIRGAGWLFAFSVLLNVYPIILQRYNRMRVERLLFKSQSQARSGRRLDE